MKLETKHILWLIAFSAISMTGITLVILIGAGNKEPWMIVPIAVLAYIICVFKLVTIVGRIRKGIS